MYLGDEYSTGNLKDDATVGSTSTGTNGSDNDQVVSDPEYRPASGAPANTAFDGSTGDPNAPITQEDPAEGSPLSISDPINPGTPADNGLDDKGQRTADPQNE